MDKLLIQRRDSGIDNHFEYIEDLTTRVIEIVVW